MIRDPVVAVAMTLVLGTAALQSRSWFDGSEGDAAVLVGVGLAIAAGPLFLWRRGPQPMIPIASIYCVVMLCLLFVVDFVLAFRHGKVDL